MPMIITRHDPELPEVRALIARHLAFAHAETPAEAVYALPAAGLRDLAFFGGRVDGQLVAVGALREIDAETVEIKSMHTLAERRGEGLGQAMLAHLLAEARARGFRTVVLETGSSEGFAPARRLYERAGFVPCTAYGSYVDGPHNAFYRRSS